MPQQVPGFCSKSPIMAANRKHVLGSNCVRNSLSICFRHLMMCWRCAELTVRHCSLQLFIYQISVAVLLFILLRIFKTHMLVKTVVNGCRAPNHRYTANPAGAFLLFTLGQPDLPDVDCGFKPDSRRMFKHV